MRTAPAVLALLAVLALVVPVAATTHGTRVVGTVTNDDGSAATDAYVLVQPEAAPTLDRAVNGSEPIVPALLDLVADPPRVVRVNDTDADGNYRVHLPSRGQYEVVAVTEDGRVSALETVTVRTIEASEDLDLDPQRVQQVDAGNAAGTPGRTTTVTVGLTNSDDEAVGGLTVPLSALPDGWSVAGVDTDGTYDESDRTLRWESVGPGETVVARVTLSVPEDAEMDTYRVEVGGSADSHFVQHAGAVRVKVGPPDSTTTPSATATPLDRDPVTVPSATAAPASGGSRGVPLLSVAVFSLGVAVAAFAVGRTGVPYLDDR